MQALCAFLYLSFLVSIQFLYLSRTSGLHGQSPQAHSLGSRQDLASP